MARFDSCPDCKGQKQFDCTSCRCGRCNASGVVAVRCSSCTDGTVQCSTCQGSGKILVKKGFFSDTYRTCSRCNGTTRHSCDTCHGKREVSGTCPSCQGSKRNASCTNCGSTGKISCSKCRGTGRVESEWSRSLRTQSVDRLKLEHEKRSQKIVAMDSQIFDLQEEYWGRGREGNIDGDLRHLRSNIAEFEGEVSAIEEELDRRHGITGADSNQPFEAQSTERLKLEHQKRQRAVLALEKRINDLQEMYWGEGREGDIDNDLSSYRREIRSLSDEMAAIEGDLDQR